jgi:hypothetical protein
MLNISELTQDDLEKAFGAVDALLMPAVKARLEPILRVKLDSLHADLLAELEDRQENSG